MTSKAGTRIRSFARLVFRTVVRDLQINSVFLGEISQKPRRAAREARTRSSDPVSAEPT